MLDSEVRGLEVAIFPLPGMVAFEGQQHLLHIFEPRYRKMIEDCVEEKIPLGLSLASKQLSKPRSAPKLSSEEILKSNHQTYEANEIFGAGPVQVIRRLEDGRTLIRVAIELRLKLLEMTQVLPYFKGRVTAQILETTKLSEQKFSAHNLLNLSKEILGQKYSLFATKLSDRIKNGDDLQALFLAIIEWFRLEASVLQALLEKNSWQERANDLTHYMKLYLESQPRPVEKDESQEVAEVISVDFSSKKPKK